jgi:3-hydroxyisobutyrate dehydrogenase-like beta-hydroxyacid dehydrogenase
MGLPVCQRLNAAGFDVRVLARREAQAKALAEMGFEVENEAATLVRGADVVFTCVSDDKALRDVVLSEGFAPALSPSVVLIDMSTVSPSVSKEVAAHLRAGVSYLRAPVSGSTSTAAAGTLTALVSGPRTAFDRMAPVFAAFTKQAFHLGEAEEARFLKLSINSMVAATSALLAEALAFGRKGGLTNEAMLDVITQSAVASPLIGYKKNMIVSGDYTAAATLTMLQKDVELFLDAGHDMGMSLPLGELVRTLYRTASGKGLGEEDFFVLVREAQRAADGG